MRKEKMPGYIIPFTKTKEDCKKAYASFMCHSWFAPKELKDSHYIDGFRGIYMPYWAYHITEKGPISLNGSKSHRRGDYIITDHYTLTGDINSSYKGISYDASSSFDDTLSASIAPFEVRNMNRFTPSYLTGFYADTADVDPNVYEGQAKQIAAMQTYQYIKGHPDTKGFTLEESPNFAQAKLNPRCERVDGAMFPVWFLSYRNGNRVAYATVNGQTGKVAADMPISIGKYLISSLILAIPIFLLLCSFFTFVPKVTLAISAVIDFIVPFLFASEMKHIAKKDGEKYKFGSVLSRNIFSFITVILSLAVLLFAPVSDIYYYGAALLNLLAVLVVLLGMIKYYNVLATRKLPQFDNYKGGDDRA
jgi:hypothetical protein